MKDSMEQTPKTKMVDPLATEKAYLKAHLEELTHAYPEKYLLLKGERAFGSFETYGEGVEAGVRLFGRGPFLVRSITAPDDGEAPSIPALAVGVPLVADT